MKCDCRTEIAARIYIKLVKDCIASGKAWSPDDCAVQAFEFTRAFERARKTDILPSRKLDPVHEGLE